MHIICLTPLEKGVYNDHKTDHIIAPPDGWAMIPEGFTLPSTFPRLGSLKAEEITYPYEVEVSKEVPKTRDVEVMGEDGKLVTVQEEYTETEIVIEQREKVIMTVTAMTEGTVPEPETPAPTFEEQLRADVDYIAVMTGVEL